jgi:hypothetical protein
MIPLYACIWSVRIVLRARAARSRVSGRRAAAAGSASAPRAAPARGRVPLGVRAARAASGRAASRSRARPRTAQRPRRRVVARSRRWWSRLGNEGGKPGGPCFSRATDLSNCPGLASKSEADPGQFANHPDFASLSAANPRWFAHHLELLPDTGRNPRRFARPPAKVCRNTRGLRQVAHERAPQASWLPSLIAAVRDDQRRERATTRRRGRSARAATALRP